MQMTKLVEDIAKALVDRPELVQVTETAGERGATLVELGVEEGDLGRVIGKQGRTARSIRSLLGAASVKHNVRYQLEILE